METGLKLVDGRGLDAFRNAGIITVLKANADTVAEVITAFKEGKLEELAEGCPHSLYICVA